MFKRLKVRTMGEKEIQGMKLIEKVKKINLLKA